MNSLKTITLLNVQSHENTVLEFPETGIIRIYGDNSNGKSVLVKGLWDVVNNGITKPKLRNSLIRRGCPYAELTYETYSGIKLFVHIHREAAQTYAELTRPGQETVRRYLADKSIPLLVQELGFHYDEKNEISVNIHRDDDPFLFTSTKHSLNCDLMDSAMSDKYAERSLDEIAKVISEIKKMKRQFEQAKAADEATLSAINLYDIDYECALREKLAYLAYNLERCETRELPEIKAVPKVSFLTKMPPMPKLRYPKVYQKMGPIPDILPIAKELQTLYDNKCPTCGRSFHGEVGEH